MITKQEEIRGGIDNILWKYCLGDTAKIRNQIQKLETKRGVVLKVDRGKDNKYLLAEFYTSRMPRVVDNPDIECGFYQSIVAIEPLIEVRSEERKD